MLLKNHYGRKLQIKRECRNKCIVFENDFSRHFKSLVGSTYYVVSRSTWEPKKSLVNLILNEGHVGLSRKLGLVLLV